MEKCLVTVPAAFMHVRDNLEELGKVADDTDLLFLKGLLDSPVVTSLVKVSEQQFSILRHLPSISIVTIKSTRDRKISYKFPVFPSNN